MRLRSALAGVACALACDALPDPPAEAPTRAATAAPSGLSPTEYLRQLSLDLRGEPPSIEELKAVLSAGKVGPEVVDAFLKSPAFSEQVKRWHGEILWPNLSRL